MPCEQRPRAPWGKRKVLRRLLVSGHQEGQENWRFHGCCCLPAYSETRSNVVFTTLVSQKRNFENEGLKRRKFEMEENR